MERLAAPSRLRCVRLVAGITLLLALPVDSRAAPSCNSDLREFGFRPVQGEASPAATSMLSSGFLIGSNNPYAVQAVRTALAGGHDPCRKPRLLEMVEDRPLIMPDVVLPAQDEVSADVLLSDNILAPDAEILSGLPKIPSAPVKASDRVARKPAAAKTVTALPAPPAPPTRKTVADAVQAQEADADYEDQSALIGDVIIGATATTVFTYAILAMRDHDRESASHRKLNVHSVPTLGLTAFDSRQLAAFSAVNTVADLQPGQQFSLGLSSGHYNHESAFAAGMSFRISDRATLKTSMSFLSDEYVTNVGLSYGW